MTASDDRPTKPVPPRQRIAWWLQAAALRLLWWLVGWMPLPWASACGSGLMALIGPFSNKHRHVLANLRMVSPQRDAVEIKRLGRQVWGNIGAVLAEFPHLEQLTDPARNAERLLLLNHTGEPDFFARRRARVFVSAHLANWELIGYAGNRVGGGFDVIYNPQPNPWLEQLVQRRRRCLGCGYVGKVSSARKLLGLLKRGRSVGLMIDVRVDGGRLVPFCGADATVTTLPAWLALQTGCDIVPIEIERQPGARFRVVFHPPLQARQQADETREQAVMRVTRTLNGVVEAWIQARPGHWLCTKRRWPKEIMKARGVYVD